MNGKFFELTAEKQQRIINAGFRVFSENSYKKSPMSEIAAAAAGTSKSLLFHYFKATVSILISRRQTPLRRLIPRASCPGWICR